ncbi:unnamed protein product [Eretmochelys imbricata]
MRAMPPAAVSGAGGGGGASAGRAERPPCCRSQSERGEGAGTAGHLNHGTAVRGGYRGASRPGTLGPLPPAQGCRIAARRGAQVSAQVTVDNVSPPPRSCGLSQQDSRAGRGEDFSFTQASQGRSSSSSTISNTAPFKGCKGKIMHVASRAEHEPDDLTVLVHVKQETESQANAIC